MWTQRVAAAGDGPLFRAWTGGPLDTANVARRVRKAFDACGYGWATFHVMRKTLDEAGLPIGDVADQLGNTRAVAEQHYVQRKVANPRTAAALEGM